MGVHSSYQYYLKKADGAIYGPSELAVLKQWAREGRIAPDDLISKDQSFWYPAPTLTDLDMNWLIQLHDGTQYGPIHLHALQELVEEGSLSAEDVVINRITERMCTIREAMAAESTSISKPVEPVSGPPAPAEPSKPVSTLASVTESTAAPAELKEAPAPSPTISETPPESVSWREIAAQKDFLERELVKWKAMYEQEHENSLRTAREAEEHVQALRKSEMAAHIRADQLERKLKESEENYRVLRESLANDASRPYVQQLITLTELHRDLSQRCDALTRLLQEKNEEINALLDARARMEAHASEILRQAQAIAEQERKEAELGRRRALEIEADYLQLVRAYRDLNEKFMRLKQDASSPPSSASSERAQKKH